MQKIKELYNTHNKYLPAAFFIAGFLFDIITLDRIDNTYTIIQQGLYIVFLIKLLELRTQYQLNLIKIPTWLSRVWHYQNEVFHFLLGSLLSSYTLFYFISASLSTSLIFLILMSALLVANELPAFQKQELGVKSSLILFCLISFFSIMVPIIFGHVGMLSFFLSIILGLTLSWAFIKKLKKWGITNEVLKKQIIIPHLGLAAFLIALYFAKALPPVPISAQYMGIYHDIKRDADQFSLYYDRPWWKFWQNGAEDFVAQPGDKIFCFARIFSPSTFSDEVVFHWQFYGLRGWETSDRISVKIKGGRADGYRGYAMKTHFQPGDWRVSVETQDQREIGRITFSVTKNEQAEERNFRIDTQ